MLISFAYGHPDNNVNHQLRARVSIQFELLNITDYSLMGVTYITCFPMSDAPGRWVRFPEYGAEGLRINATGPLP